MIRVSNRFPESLDPNVHTTGVADLQKSGRQLLDLTVSNPTVSLPDYPNEAIAQALGRVTDFAYRPDPFGAQQAREAISAYYAERGLMVGPHRIALTASTSDAYSVLFKLLCDPGDEVLVPTPSYPLFEHLARFDSVSVKPYLLRYDGLWHVDFGELDTRVSPRTRAIVTVNPNNPTGSFLKQDEANRLLSWAEQRSLAIISDEVFLDYNWSAPASAVKSLSAFPDRFSFSLNGLSKAAGMPQMKLGWIVANGPSSECAHIMSRLELLLDTYLSVNTPVQYALHTLLKIGSGVREQLSRIARENLRHLQIAIAGQTLHCLMVEGGWTAILQLPRVCSEDEWTQLLLHEHGVLTQPGYFFDMQTEPYIVVSLITPCDIFRNGLDGIARCVQQGLGR